MAVNETLTAEIGLVLYPNCQLAAVYGLTDLFRIAGEWAAPLEEPNTARRIRVSHWQIGGEDMACVWDSHPGRPHKLTHVIAPPSIIMPESMAPMPRESAWMAERHREGVTVGSVCAGAFVLAETGLMDGRRATTHWAFAEQLARRFPQIELAAEHMVIDEGDIMTAGGILAWTDLGLTLVERFLGVGTMLATARFLLVDPPRRLQDPYRIFVPRFDHGDVEILKVQQHLHAVAADAHSIPELARLAGLADRTFLRRFQKATGLTPTEYLQQLRVLKARDLLETTNRPVDQIGWSVGYADPAAFRKIFQRLAGVSPRHYRQRFGRAMDGDGG